MSKSDKPTRITIAPDDACIVFNASGDTQLYMPEQDGDALVPPHVVNLMRCVALLNDERAEPMLEQLDKLLKAH